jgi:hypothetical protein
MALAHRLKECSQNLIQITKRHNLVCSVIKQAVIKHVVDGLQSNIRENTAIGSLAPDLPEELRALRPDLVFL